jgi:anti-sigma factor RsiW
MNCSEFISHFTDYLDGSASSEDLRVMEVHLAGCGSCRRYRAVLEHGSSLLRSLPKAELREDFGPRLEHRLYHVQEERSLSEHVASGAPALAVLGIAVLLAAAAWAPLLLESSPVVELQPIVVDRAPPRLPARPVGVMNASSRARDDGMLDIDLWDDARLYEYSTLNRGYRSGPQPRQVGFAPDR